MPRRLAAAVAVALVAALPALASALGADYVVAIATRVAIFALAAASLNLIVGYGGMVSFGHAAFFGTGAYVVAILAHHASLDAPLVGAFTGTESALLAWPAAVGMAALAALVIGAISLRTSGLSFIMITLAFAQMLYFFFVSLEPYGGDDGLSLWSRSRLPFVDLERDVQFYYVVVALLAGVLVLKRRLVAARFGLVLRGIRDNERRMRALGYATTRYKLCAFVIAGAVAGLAGALMANQSEFVSPAVLDWRVSGEILVMVVLGGMGTVLGPVVGAVAFLVLEEVLSQWTTHWAIVMGPLLIAVVLWARRGIWGALRPRLGDD